MALFYITPTLLNSWSYCIKNGTLEDFIKVLNKEPFEDTESIIKGKAFEKYMQNCYEETLGGAYQVPVSKEHGDYLLYGIVDGLKGGIIYDYKYTKNYDVGKFFGNHQTLMYLEMVPEANKMVYLITNKFDTEIEVNMPLNYLTFQETEVFVGDIFREEYTKDMFPETIDSVLHKFEQWLKAYNLFDLYAEKWKCKY
ncbi:MAG: hypothetical protein HFJ52_07700 [Clostridia bacterium]|nr:hypothetical protein [Clostridia bacterium]